MKKEILEKIFSSPEWQKMLDDLPAELEAEYQKDKAYYESDEFEKHYQIIRDYIQKNDHLTDNPYSFPCPNLTNDQFCIFVSVAMQMNTKKVINNIDPECPFETETLLFREIEVKTMHGQGTAYFAKKPTLLTPNILKN